MKLPKKQAAVVRAALEEWRASGLLDEETGKRLLDDLTPLPFDWYRLGRYALWSALTCILIGVAALLGDELFLELISRLFVMTELGRSLFLILAAAGLFFWGVRRPYPARHSPHRGVQRRLCQRTLHRGRDAPLRQQRIGPMGRHTAAPVRALGNHPHHAYRNGIRHQLTLRDVREGILSRPHRSLFCILS